MHVFITDCLLRLWTLANISDINIYISLSFSTRRPSRMNRIINSQIAITCEVRKGPLFRLNTRREHRSEASSTQPSSPLAACAQRLCASVPLCLHLLHFAMNSPVLFATKARDVKRACNMPRCVVSFWTPPPPQPQYIKHNLLRAVPKWSLSGLQR
jgi:hypothetical protein